MQVRVEIFTVNKRFPLTISRGTTAQTTNVWLRVEEDIEGWGKRRLFGEPSAIYRNNPERITASSAGIASIQPVRTTAD